MTDDIVTRLRFDYASCECSGTGQDCDRCETEQYAADEIEYLRNEMANQNSEYNKLWAKHNAVMRDKLFPLNKNYTEFIHPEGRRQEL